MEQLRLYEEIARRTQGDIYIGVVGPVRTGKSTFIKKFMETMVLPNIENDFRRERAVDELPQSAAGKTIMTTEPKFIPEEAVELKLEDGARCRVRMLDCVGYIVPSAIGYVENDLPRMVRTPWFDQEIPFNMAAEIGTQKVIREHSTLGLVVTTDGSISDIPRHEYQEAEERVINELKELGKPFMVLLNCADPHSTASRELKDAMESQYQVPVAAVNCLELSEENIHEILQSLLSRFPVREICFDLPRWILSLEKDHWLKSALYEEIFSAVEGIELLDELRRSFAQKPDCEYISRWTMEQADLGQGRAEVTISVPGELFYRVLGESTGLEIQSEEQLLPCMAELARIKGEYEKIRGALEEVEATGYGIVMPTLDELTLEEPEIVRQGGKYGVRLKASAPSIHMMRAEITTEVSPIVGSEKQSEDLVMYLMKEFEENPKKIWESNIFGKSLHGLVNEGLHNKLYRMPTDARLKLQETIERIINEGCSGLICIIL